MYIYIYIYIYICMCMYVYIYIYIYICMCMYVYINILIYIYIYIHIILYKLLASNGWRRHDKMDNHGTSSVETHGLTSPRHPQTINLIEFAQLGVSVFTLARKQIWPMVIVVHQYHRPRSAAGHTLHWKIASRSGKIKDTCYV